MLFASPKEQLCILPAFRILLIYLKSLFVKHSFSDYQRQKNIFNSVDPNLYEVIVDSDEFLSLLIKCCSFTVLQYCEIIHRIYGHNILTYIYFIYIYITHYAYIIYLHLYNMYIHIYIYIIYIYILYLYLHLSIYLSISIYLYIYIDIYIHNAFFIFFH